MHLCLVVDAGQEIRGEDLLLERRVRQYGGWFPKGPICAFVVWGNCLRSRCSCFVQAMLSVKQVVATAVSHLSLSLSVSLFGCLLLGRSH